MKVLVTTQLHEATEKILEKENVYYYPEIAKKPELIITYILHYKPECIVVGANPISSVVLHEWRNVCKRQSLYIIRRGTGLSAIDQVAAEKYKVTVFNTPDINSPYVAQYISDNLLIKPQEENIKIAIIGAGFINSRVIKKLLRQHLPVTIYTPSLSKDEMEREKWMEEWGITEYKTIIRFAESLEEAFENANYISIAIPLISAGSFKTKHVITKDHIQKIATNATLVSICEPEIFSIKALLKLYERTDSTVLLDNAKPLLDDVWKIITQKLGLPINLPVRKNFILQSRAMQVQECAKDMDQAILLKLATIELDRLEIKKALLKKIKDTDKKNVIVGCGISGIMQAIILYEKGYRNITIIDASSETENTLDKIGITLGGANCRHVSLTETTPHADKTREKVFSTFPREGGWQLRSLEEITESELQWITTFMKLTQKSGLHNLAKEFVVTVNKKGLELWKLLLKKNPELFVGCKDKRLLRLFLSEKSFQEGWIYQSKINRNTKRIDNNTLLQTQKCLREPIKKDYISGGIEVDGFGFNIHIMMAQLIKMAKNRGVKFYWDTKIIDIKNVERKTKKLITEMESEISGDFFIFTTGSNALGLLENTKLQEKINGVIGCWVTIPNPGLTGPLKIHAEDPVGVMNCIVAEDSAFIHISGGFGYIGKMKADLHDKQVNALFARVEHVIKRLFPKEYQKATEENTLDRKICTRPMTPDGIPILDTITMSENAFFVGGTNAGGTVEAPILGLIAAQLENKSFDHIKTILKISRYSLE